MKARGIMRISSSLIRPGIGVVTSIHRAHLTRLGSLQKIIEAKAEILEHLSTAGTLIINWDDPTCHKFPLHRYKGEIVRFGFSEQCDIWASDIQRNGVSTSFTVHTREFEFPCTINIIGNYNVGNALAAVAVGLKMWLSPAEITQGLAGFEPRDGRLKVHTKSNGAIIIDDNFNANPDSTRMLIDELITMALERPLVLVLGDMERPDRDIAKYARRVHFNIGRQLAKGEFQHVMAIGKWAGQYVRGALQSGFPKDKISYYQYVRSAQDEFNKLLTPGITVVLKASPYTDLNYLRVNSTDI
jgi:UDP-N-acetylmuramoyl-tripeptide--D-alanyl-D-alanine ligase